MAVLLRLPVASALFICWLFSLTAWSLEVCPCLSACLSMHLCVCICVRSVCCVCACAVHACMHACCHVCSVHACTSGVTRRPRVRLSRLGRWRRIWRQRRQVRCCRLVSLGERFARQLWSPRSLDAAAELSGWVRPETAPDRPGTRRQSIGF
jgi:hypothetical protein